jgi:DNA repair exonuclease SbcCD ATPase subunit
MLQREVPQTVVNFSGHRLVCLTDNEPDTRRELMKRGFDYLIEVALQGLASTRLQKQQLEQQQQMLLFQKKARLLKAAKPGLEALLEPATSEPTDVDAIEQQLQEVEAELDQLRADSGTLEQHLEKVAATLAKPEDVLRLESVSFTLDHMNTKVPPNSRRVANTLTFDEMVLAEERRLIALFIRFPSHELLPPPDFLAEARRFL